MLIQPFLEFFEIVLGLCQLAQPLNDFGRQRPTAFPATPRVPTVALSRLGRDCLANYAFVGTVQALGPWIKLSARDDEWIGFGNRSIQNGLGERVRDRLGTFSDQDAML